MARSEKTTAAPSPVALPARDTMRKPRASSDIGISQAFQRAGASYKEWLSPELMVSDVFDSFEEKEEVFVDEGILSEFLAINYWVT